MKTLILTTLLLLATITLNAQDTALPDTTGRPFAPMSATYQRAADYGNRYYLHGSDTAFTGILYGRFDNGELMTLQEFDDGIGNGSWVNFNPDGTVAERGSYVNNRVEGPAVLYYEDGSVKARGRYLHWKRRIGEWTFYDRSGAVVHTLQYTR